MTQMPPARYLLRAKDFVDARYAEQITVQDLAAAAGRMPSASAYARVPNCILQRDTRPVLDSRVKTAHREKTGGVRRP